jgi:hypothetical protein
MHRWPLALMVLGLALHFPGALWHDLHHSHEGLETLVTQAGFYIAAAFVLAGALLGFAWSRGSARMRLAYGVAVVGALVATGGWVWDFAAHFSGGHSAMAHALTYLGPVIAILGGLAALYLGRAARGSE